MIWIVLVIVAVVVVWYIAAMNSLRQKEIKIDEALSGIDVALTKRYDVLTKSLEVVKGFAKHEEDILSEVISLRQGMDMKERQTADQKMNALQGRIFALAESYPELEISDVFKEFQEQIAEVEEHLQAARRAYNANVSSLNQSIVAFPTSIVANMIHAEKREFFEAEETKRKDVEIKF